MNQFFLVREASPSSSSPQGVAPTEPTAPQPTTGCRHTIPHHASYGNIQSSPTLGAGVRYIMPDYRLVNPRPDLNIVRPYVQNVLYARRSPSPAHTFVVSEHDLISEDDIAPSRYYASWYNPSLVPHSHVPHHTYDEAALCNMPRRRHHYRSYLDPDTVLPLRANRALAEQIHQHMTAQSPTREDSRGAPPQNLRPDEHITPSPSPSPSHPWYPSRTSSPTPPHNPPPSVIRSDPSLPPPPSPSPQLAYSPIILETSETPSELLFRDFEQVLGSFDGLLATIIGMCEVQRRELSWFMDRGFGSEEGGEGREGKDGDGLEGRRGSAGNGKGKETEKEI
jgi:hypothetical protein